MQKLKQSYLNRMLQASMTSNEVNFILYLSHYQSEEGEIIGVYYKDVCDALRISPQGFYDILRALETKELLTWKKNNYYDVDIKLTDNDFTGYNYKNLNKGEGYINTNYQLFYSEAFLELRGPEKLLAMDFLKNYLAGKRSYAINVKRFVEKYRKLLGVTRRTLISYVKMLKLFFSIGIKDGVYYITPLKAYREKNHRQEQDIYEVHQFCVGLRRNRIKEVPKKDSKSMKDMLGLFKQYSTYIKGFPHFNFSQVVYNMLEVINKEISNKYKWRRILNAALLNRELRLYLGLN